MAARGALRSFGSALDAPETSCHGAVATMCGVFGIYGHAEAASLAYLGLHALQHRGQESAGIAVGDGRGVRSVTRMGLVQSGFSDMDLASMPGSLAIGHVRYSTAGGSDLASAQPLTCDVGGGPLALAHNGTLTHHDSLRRALELEGATFRTDSDTEVLLHLIARSGADTLEGRVVDALRQVEGAYSLVVASATEVVAVRDPMGFRPLCLGRIPAGPSCPHGATVVASESVAVELVGGQGVREIEPGELVRIDAHGIVSRRPFEPRPRRACIFEHVYFARPDARIEGASVYAFRKRCGALLYDEHPLEGASASDCVVVPVPDSGVPAAIGLAQHAGLPFEIGFVRSHFIGRTFLEPSHAFRHIGVTLKLSPNPDGVRGKRVVVVDDSIVRGTTSRNLVAMLRAAGALEVHVRVTSPPTRWPCFYGIDTPTRGELLAASHGIEEVRRHLGADSLGHLSLEGLAHALRDSRGSGAGPERDAERDGGHCHACFSGDYPLPLPTGAVSPRHLQVLHR